MDHIKVCGACKGDGFLRYPRSEVHPYTNVACAVAIYADGSRSPAMDAPYLRKGPIALYEFKCSMCDGSGEIMWKRGQSLVPDCP